jgi:hypothetical protein
MSGDATIDNAGALTIANEAVTNAKLADMATDTIKGRDTAGTGVPEDLTTTEVTAMLNAFTDVLQGLAPASGGGTTNFLRADGNWAAPSDTGITELTGDVTAGPGSGSQAATIADDAVTDAKLRESAGLSVIGRSANSTGNPADITAASDGEVLRRSGTSIGFGDIGFGALPQLTSYEVYGNPTGSTADAQSSSLSDLIDGAISSVQGSVLYRNASAWVALSPGADGEVLTSGGAAADVAWEDSGVSRLLSATQALTTCTTARTVDWSTGVDFTLLLTSANECTISFSNPVSGSYITIELTNGSGAGDATVVWPSIRWAVGAAPTMTTGAAALDICTIKYNGAAYSGSCIQNMSTP